MNLSLFFLNLTLCFLVVVKSCEIEPEDRVYAHFKVESIKIETKENEEKAAEVLLGDD